MDKNLAALLMNPTLNPLDPETARFFGRSPVIAACKALSDAAHSPSSGLGIKEKEPLLKWK